MRRGSPSLWEFLDRYLARKRNDASKAFARQRLDKSEVVAMMERVAEAVNERTGDLLIEVQSYLPPEALVRSFSFQKNNRDYVLQLESWGPDPRLVALSRKWRGPLFLSSLGWIYRLLGIEEHVIEVPFECAFRPEDVTEADIEQWFVYLISGFDRSFAPAIPRNGGLPSPEPVGNEPQSVAQTSD